MKVTTYKTLLSESGLPTLVKEKDVEYPEVQTLDSPDAVTAVLRDVFQHHRLTEEHVYLLALNTKNDLLGVFEVSHGTGRVSVLQTREVFMKALLAGSQRIIIAHNHPSGDPTPSEEDLEIMEDIKEAGHLLKVPLLDFMIIGNQTYYSAQEAGCM